MGPKSSGPSTGDVFKPPLLERINLRHPLVRLADVYTIFIRPKQPRVEAFEFYAALFRKADPPG